VRVHGLPLLSPRSPNASARRAHSVRACASRASRFSPRARPSRVAFSRVIAHRIALLDDIYNIVIFLPPPPPLLLPPPPISLSLSLSLSPPRWRALQRSRCSIPFAPGMRFQRDGYIRGGRARRARRCRDGSLLPVSDLSNALHPRNAILRTKCNVT